METSNSDKDSYTNNKEEFEPPIQVFHNLMPYKIREILLVSSLYDAFIVEEEGLISEMVIWEYRHLLLSSPPRVTHVTSGKEAIEKVANQNFDLIITMSKNIGMNPFKFGKNIKKISQNIPIILLATDTADLHFCQEHVSEEGIDKAFFWYGDTSLFLTIVKYVEDSINAPHDSIKGNVQVILVIEDSIRDYSLILPVIYSEIVQQTQRSISDDLNEMQRLLRRRARPKILLANNYEDGIELFNKYQKNILGVISDVKFPRKYKIDHQAGHDFIKFIKNINPTVPTMLQSSNPDNRLKAEEMGSYFINKNSPSLMQDFNHFLLKHLGFGDFIFLQPTKEHNKKETDKKHHNKIIELTKASNLEEFERALQEVPLESIRFHSNRNDFSNWLMARCEFKLAKKLRPQQVSDFNTLDEMRKYLVKVFNESRRERHLGVMTDFPQQKFEFDSSYTKIGGDSLGGKGRGIAFIRTLLTRYEIINKFENVDIRVPSSVAISTDEFDRFISENNLYSLINNNKISDDQIAKMFLNSKLQIDLKNKLSVVLKHFKKPIAVRSSSLLEDSQNHPFAGMYSTYMLPNNNLNDEKRLEQLCDAIKLVYASVFYKDARIYIESTNAKIEEEKMAVIIQELEGNEYDRRFYPTLSGVAQSYNFYPVSNQKREEGIVSLAVGLGYSVVGGENVLRFSPYYPNVIPDFSDPASIFKNSQKELYVLNIKNKDIKLTKRENDTLEKINISEIIDDGTLENIVSTYNQNDGIIRDIFSREGPILVTFSGILKYNLFPLAEIIRDILFYGEKSIGSPIEIEFAVNLNPSNKSKPIFSIIQIRPLVLAKEHNQISWDEKSIIKDNILIKSNKSLGNGLINNISDIVYVSPEKFDSSKTIEISDEVGKINQLLQNKPFLLIGPGRWGTQDRWLGIPVRWSDISNVKVIVETSMENYNIKPSQGTHFFQNILSKGIGYVNTTYRSKDNLVDWNWLKNSKPINELNYITHIRLKKPLIIKLDGRSGKALILKQ